MPDDAVQREKMPMMTRQKMVKKLPWREAANSRPWLHKMEVKIESTAPERPDEFGDLIKTLSPETRAKFGPRYGGSEPSEQPNQSPNEDSEVPSNLAQAAPAADLIVGKKRGTRFGDFIRELFGGNPTGR